MPIEWNVLCIGKGSVYFAKSITPAKSANRDATCKDAKRVVENVPRKTTEEKKNKPPDFPEPFFSALGRQREQIGRSGAPKLVSVEALKTRFLKARRTLRPRLDDFPKGLSNTCTGRLRVSHRANLKR